MQKRIFLLTLCFSLHSVSHAAIIIPEVNAKSNKTRSTKPIERMQTTQFRQKEIAESPVINLSELLRQEQSIVRLTNGDNRQSALSIRGFGDNAAANSLILVDGFPLTNSSLLPPNFNAISLSDIERLAIFQGSQGSRWGDQAVGGVLSINTRLPHGNILEVVAEKGSFNKTFLSAYLAKRFTNGIFIKTSGFNNETDNYRQHNHQHDKTGLLQTGIEYAKGLVSVKVQTTQTSAEIPGGLTETQYKAHPRQASNFLNYIDYTINLYQLLIKHSISSNWMVETRLGRQTTASDGRVAITSAMNESQDFFNPELIGRIHDHKLLVGYTYQNNDYKISTLLNTNQVNAKQQQLYGQWIAPIFSTIDLTIGSRLAQQRNQTSQSYTNQVWVNELGVAYKLNDALEFYLRRDTNFRFPKANEMLWLAEGVARLHAQTGRSYEGGLKLRREQFRAQLSLYQLALHNEIAFNPTKTLENPVGSFQNYSNTLRQGVTLTEDWRLTPKWNIDSQINYVNARFQSGLLSGKSIPAVPALNANAGLSYFWSEAWRAKYTALYTGSRYASLDRFNKGQKQPGYWLSLISLQYKPKWWVASFEVINLFNQKYTTATVYNTQARDITYYPGSGREYQLTVKLLLD